jgi:hypothetical protein
MCEWNLQFHAVGMANVLVVGTSKQIAGPARGKFYLIKNTVAGDGAIGIALVKELDHPIEAMAVLDENKLVIASLSSVVVYGIVPDASSVSVLHGRSLTKTGTLSTSSRCWRDAMICRTNPVTCR